MKATFVELRQKSSEIIRSLERNETVTVFYRGKAKAIMRPVSPEAATGGKTADHPAFGLWANREDMAVPAAYVRSLRRGRFHDL